MEFCPGCKLPVPVSPGSQVGEQRGSRKSWSLSPRCEVTQIWSCPCQALQNPGPRALRKIPEQMATAQPEGCCVPYWSLQNLQKYFIYFATLAANNPPHTSASRGPRRSPLSSPFGNIHLFVFPAKFIQLQLTVLFSIFLSVIISTPAGRCFSNKNLILLDIIILGHFLFLDQRCRTLFSLAQWEPKAYLLSGKKENRKSCSCQKKKLKSGYTEARTCFHWDISNSSVGFISHRHK